jgi:hypothetical protein
MCYEAAVTTKALRSVRSLLALACVLTACAQTRVASIGQALALPPSDIAGAAHGYPALRTLDGAALADGEFTQWLEGDRLHITIRYDFAGEHYVEEHVQLQQSPELVQHSWSWVEVRAGELERRFEVNFDTGEAVAEKRDGGEVRHWSEHFDVQRGHSFAGSAFTFALTSLRTRLLAGETIELQTVGFTPQPRLAVVAISHAGVDRVPMAGREILGDRFLIHPKLPAIAKLFVKVPDTLLWLVADPPAAFLRWEGPLAEPSDPIMRIDLLPGEPSGPAVPASRHASDGSARGGSTPAR